MFNPRWRKDYVDTSAIGIAADVAFGGTISVADDHSNGNMGLESQRMSELSAIAKDIMIYSVYDETTFNLTKASLTNLSEVVRKSIQIRETQHKGAALTTRNFLQVRTKGRPKTGSKRYKSSIEKTKKTHQEKQRSWLKCLNKMR